MNGATHPKRKFAWLARFETWRLNLSAIQRDLLHLGLILAAAAVMAAAAYAWGRPAWRAWRHRQALGQSLDYAGRGDYRNSMLALKRATDLAPLDLATWREVSDRLAELGSPQAVTARENLVRLAPGDQSLRLALINEALRFGRLDTAETALRELDEAARSDAGFHRLAAALALATGETARLEEHLAALVAAAPHEVVARFNLAALRLWDAEPAREAAALTELESLTAEPAVRIRAGLELLKHAARAQDADRARRVVDLLLARLGSDVGANSEIAAPGEPAGWRALIRALQAEAARRGAPECALVAQWMADLRLRAEALTWLDSLPAALRDAAPVLQANAALSAGLEDDERLENLLRAGALGPLPADSIRLALAARLQLKRYQETNGRSTWKDAISASRQSPAALLALARLAELWHDPESAEQALLAILRIQPDATWAYPALRDNYLARKDMTKLWQLYGTWLQARPDDPTVTRIWLHLGAVLDRATTEASALARRRAADPAASPLDCALGAAHAWRRNQTPEAQAFLAKLPPESLRRPDLAFWIAVILADTKHSDQARTALTAARRPGLSEEETALLEKAARTIGEPLN